MADDDFSAFGTDDDDPRKMLAGILSPQPAQSLVAPPPNTAPRTPTSTTTPQTGSLSYAPTQAQPKVAGPAMLPGVAARPETLAANPAQPASPIGAVQPAVARGVQPAVAAQPAMSAQPVRPAQPSMVTQPAAQPTQLSRDQARLSYLTNSGSGVSQIKNPFLRGLARVGDVAASIAAPGFAALVPGTTLHHQVLVGQQRGVVGSDIQNQDVQQQSQQRAAKAQQDLADAQRDALRSPTPGEVEKYNLDPAGQYRPQELGRMAIEANKTNKPDSVQGMYASAVGDALQRGVDPGKDPKVQQLADSITALQKQSAGKEPGREDKAVAIYAKDPSQRTPEDNAFIRGYEKDVKVTKTDPGVARTSVFLQMPQAVADPSVPGGVKYVTRAGAIGQEAPQSSTVRVPADVLRDFTSGVDAHTVTNFNTAYNHLQQLSKVSTALKNNDIQGFNQLANEFAKQTGSPAPTNFQAVRDAVAGEVSKTFKGSGATDAEISKIEADIQSKNSPAQLAGVINQYQTLIGSKRDNLKQQFEQGIKGQPNFGNGNQTPARDPNMLYARDPQGKLHASPRDGAKPLPQGWKYDNQPAQPKGK